MSRVFTAGNLLSYAGSMGITASPVTVFGWFKRAAAGAGNWNSIVKYRNAAGSEVALQHTGSNRMRIGANQSGGYRAAETTATVTSGVWFPAIGIYKADNSLELRALGEAPTGDSNAGAFVTESSPVFEIGADSTDGKIAHVAMWSSALSGGDITSLLAGAVPSSIASGSLIEYWALTGASLVGVNGRTLSVTGTVTSDTGDNPSVGSSAPTGSGALQAQAATVTGTATVTSVDVSASGALQAQAAAVSGVAVDFQVVTGSGIVTDNTSLFFNLNFAPVDGDKVGIPRDWLGSVIGLSADGRFTVTPALPDETVIPRISYDASTTTWYQDNVTLADNGSLTIYASGALQAQAAAVAGVAFVPGMITASGALQALAAVVAGSASIVIPIPPATGDQSRGHYRYQGMGTFRGRSFS